MSKERDFHKQVRVVYRALRKIYGLEKTQDEALRVFKIVFPELNRVRQSEENDFFVPNDVITGIQMLRHRWQPSGAFDKLFDKTISQMLMSVAYSKEQIIQFYEDILPVVMRIRKLTPIETGILMDLTREDVQKMYDAGLSNSSIYKLHGNSVVVGCYYQILRKLLVDKTPEATRREPIQLSLF